MSKIINGLKWHNGRETCRIVCNLLGDYGMAVVNWVDMSDYGIDRRRDRAYDLQLVFTMFRAQRDGKFVTVVQMAALPMDGRIPYTSDFTCAKPEEQVTDEHIAELLHDVVDDDSEPQYTVVNATVDGESGWYVSDGGYDMNIVRYADTEWPFEEERRAKEKRESESRSDWNKNASILRIKDMLESMPENAVLGVERVVEVMHG